MKKLTYCLVMVMCLGSLAEAQDLIIDDFEDGAAFEWSTTSASFPVSKAANPDPDATNGSDSVMLFESGNQAFNHHPERLAEDLEIFRYKQLSVDLYFDGTASQYAPDMEEVGGGNVNDFGIGGLVADEWQTLITGIPFQFGGVNDFNITFFLNPSNAAETNIYVDNVKLVAKLTIPDFAYTSVAGDSIFLQFGEPVSKFMTTNAAFEIIVDGGSAVNPSSVVDGPDGTVIILILSSAVTAGQVVEVNYDKNGGGNVFNSSIFTQGDSYDGLPVSNSVGGSTWNGASWSNGVPSSTNAFIAGDYTGAGFACNDLIISTGAVSITSGTLDIAGNVINDGSMSIASGASLINYESKYWEGTTEITISRDTRYADGKYSFVGTPVYQSSSITGEDLGTTVYEYDETVPFGTDALNRWVDADASELVPGRGYAQAFQQSISFAGVPNAGDIVYEGTYTEDVSNDVEGFNLVSNPYPAAINVASFLSGNDNTTGTIYIWDDNDSESGRGDDDDYITINNVGVVGNSTAGNSDRYNSHIGAAQGFFVQLSGSANTDIYFTEDMRVSGNNADANFFRKAINQKVKLSISSEELYSETLIGEVSNSSAEELSPGYDAMKLFSANALNIYSLKGESKLSIQGVPSFSGQMIPLGIKVSQEGDYTIKLNESSEVSGEMAVFLIDHLTDALYDLTESSVSLKLLAEDNNGRFSVEIREKSASGIIASNQFDGQYDGEALSLLFSNQLVGERAQIEIHDITGRQIASFNDTIEDSRWVGNVDLEIGSVYVVRLRAEHFSAAKKFIFIQ